MGRYKHGAWRTKLYHVWQCMKDRCHNSKHIQYMYYGGRGIYVCNEWLHDYKSFQDWAIRSGYKDGLLIDRIDNNKGYSPDNCRWATNKEQIRNRNSTIMIESMGVNISLAEWAERLNIKYRTIITRYSRGKRPPELFNPVRVYKE